MKNLKILVLDGHPDAESYCAALTNEYFENAKTSGIDIKKIAIRNLEFDPVLRFGYRKKMLLEPDLIDAQNLIKWCDHLVIITPVWWGSIPSLFKGFIDRTFIRGFSHSFDPEKKMPIKLLKGRSLHVIYTQGAPFIYSYLITGDAFWKEIKRCIFSVCGFKPIKRTCFDKVKSGTDNDRLNFIKKVGEFGKLGK